MLAYHGIIVSSTCERFGHIVPSLGARNSYVINSRLTNYCGQIGCKIRSMAVSFEGVAKIVSKLIARKDADVFRDPVPWEEYGLTDYLQIVKVPMDLGTVLEKLKKRQYGTLNDCGNVVNLLNKHSNFTSVEPVTSSYDVAQIFHSD